MTRRRTLKLFVAAMAAALLALATYGLASAEGEVAVDIPVVPGWNLVSLPVVPAGMRNCTLV